MPEVAASAVARYGAWASPLSAAALATASASIGHARAHGGRLYWSESRPDEGGRIALMALGATDEGKPGPRGDTFYAGYFRDLDGNKLNAFFMG